MSLGRDIIKMIDPDKHYAVAIWSTEDVLDHANEQPGIELSQEQVEDIIDEIDRKQDCSCGINWDVLDFYIQDVLHTG